jgi:hypothetical protein
MADLKQTTDNQTRPSADTLNAYLTRGGVVRVATYLRVTVYRAKHAGMFFERGGSLYVRSGKGSNCLSFGDRLLVKIAVSL